MPELQQRYIPRHILWHLNCGINKKLFYSLHCGFIKCQHHAFFLYLNLSDWKHKVMLVFSNDSKITFLLLYMFFTHSFLLWLIMINQKLHKIKYFYIFCCVSRGGDVSIDLWRLHFCLEGVSKWREVLIEITAIERGHLFSKGSSADMNVTKIVHESTPLLWLLHCTVVDSTMPVQLVVSNKKHPLLQQCFRNTSHYKSAIGVCMDISNNLFLHLPVRPPISSCQYC